MNSPSVPHPRQNSRINGSEAKCQILTSARLIKAELFEVTAGRARRLRADAVEKLQFLETVVGKLTIQGNVKIRRDGSRKDLRKPPAGIYDGLGVRCSLISRQANILSDFAAVPILEFFNSIRPLRTLALRAKAAEPAVDRPVSSVHGLKGAQKQSDDSACLERRPVKGGQPICSLSGKTMGYFSYGRPKLLS